MEALILAAGQGSRLKEGRPKCLVDVGGRPLIDHQLAALRWAGVEQVTVVVGHQALRVCQALPQDAQVVHNPLYAQTNSLYSFWLARDRTDDDLIVLNCDVLFHPAIVRGLVRWPGSALAYDRFSGLEPEHMKVAIRDGALDEMSKELDPTRTRGENVGLIRLSAEAAEAAFDAAEHLIGAGRVRDWLATAVNRAARAHHVQCLDVAGLPWVEIDFPEDLDHARRNVLPAIGELPEPVPHLVPAAA
jgi:choline kinase